MKNHSMILEADIDKFILELKHQIEVTQAFENIRKDLEPKQTWDKLARERIGEITKEVLMQCFPDEWRLSKDAEEAVYVEGKGTPTWWKPPYKIFGSQGVYPDIGIKMPKTQKRISIELDHSEIGRNETPGSKFKIALAKASFGHISQDWDYCYLFFCNYSGRPLKKYLDSTIEKDILKKYEEELHTKAILFPPE